MVDLESLTQLQELSLSANSLHLKKDLVDSLNLMRQLRFVNLCENSGLPKNLQKQFGADGYRATPAPAPAAAAPAAALESPTSITHLRMLLFGDHSA